MKEGYIVDFVSGNEVPGTPEEVEAVQVFSKQLVLDYGYPKDHIVTHPQFRVKCRPSDDEKEYPIDIGVFSSDKISDDTLSIIVECKKKTREDGKTQLQDYMRLSKAYLGVWFNGDERMFIQKIEANGKVLFKEIPNIPKYGQRLEDIGLYLRKNLDKPHNLKATFKAIRNYLAANTVGTTRDEALAQQIINVIFCKIYDEKFTKPDDMVSFRCGVLEPAKDVGDRIKAIFENVKRVYKDVIEKNDEISLDDDSIRYVVGELQNYSLMEAQRDVIADAFEVFISHALKGGQGQFFTPRNVIKMMVEIIAPKRTEMVIDPACGSGGFLIESLRYIWNSVEVEGKAYNWNENVVNEEKKDVSYNCIRGIDKDYFLAKVCKAYMAIIGDGKSGIFCEDSLDVPSNWSAKTLQKIDVGKFDCVVTNPPFGSKMPVTGETKLAQYELSSKWKEKSGGWVKDKQKTKEAPQILFIERCYQLLKENGRMAIVLPDGVFGNESLAYVRSWILEHFRVVGVIDIPLETFLPNTGTKTSILLVKKSPKSERDADYPVFMAVADHCGHDRRGKEIEADDIPGIPEKFRAWCKENGVEF